MVRGKIFIFVIVFIPTTGVYGITRPGLSNKTLPTNHNANLGHRAPPTESTRGDCHGYRAKHSKNGRTFAQKDGFFDTPLQLLPLKDILFLFLCTVVLQEAEEGPENGGKMWQNWCFLNLSGLCLRHG